MNIYIENAKIRSANIRNNGKLQEITATKYLSDYFQKLGLSICENADLNVNVNLDETANNDTFSITLSNKELTVNGGKRGVIYAVFSFLELLGFRFFTPTLETMPQKDVYLTDFSKTEDTPFEFRDVLSNGAGEKAWSLKQKLNSNLWNIRKLKEEDGGGYDYAGIPAHSLCGAFLMKPFVDTHPEYFSLVNGERHTDRMGQICMTNDEAIVAVAEEACRVLRSDPEKNIISISQGDNRNFCQCPACQEAVKEQGLMQTYFKVVCKIAALIKKEFPKVLVHTLAYADLCATIDFELEDNIMLQYCYGKCTTHALDDENCAMNRESAAQIVDMCKKCNNVHVWNYTNCFKHELFEYPFVHNMRRNMRFFADAGVKGVFNEGMHRSDEETDFAVTMELRSYILAKLMWNPYMSDEEFWNHIREFCQAFYGKGGQYIVEYLHLFEELSGDCGSYDACGKAIVMGEESTVVIHTLQANKTKEFVTRANILLNKASALADKSQEYNINKLRTTVLYYELYHTMEDILAYGTEQEKAQVLQKNSELIDRIIEQRLVITFWGRFRKDQNTELETMRETPPNKWNYKW